MVPRRDTGSNRGTIAALLAVLVLVGVLYWGIEAIVAHNALQNCIDSGRRDCVDRVR